jgi:hypothetical protein
MGWIGRRMLDGEFAYLITIVPEGADLGKVPNTLPPHHRFPNPNRTDLSEIFLFGDPICGFASPFSVMLDGEFAYLITIVPEGADLGKVPNTQPRTSYHRYMVHVKYPSCGESRRGRCQFEVSQGEKDLGRGKEGYLTWTMYR